MARALLAFVGSSAAVIGVGVALVLQSHGVAVHGALGVAAAGLGACVAAAWPPDNGIVIRRRRP